MMNLKILLIVLLFFNISFSQNSVELVTDPGFEGTVTDWYGTISNMTAEAYVADPYAGSQSLQMNGDVGSEGYCYQLVTVEISTTYTLATWFKSSESGRTPANAIYDHNGGGGWLLEKFYAYYADWTLKTDEFTTGGSCTSVRAYLRVTGSGDPMVAYADLYSIRKKLTKLYIAKTGNDTGIGESGTPILTLGEAEDRGFYSGGAFDIATGTYDETFTVTNDVTITGTSCTVTAIACGANTVTLEGNDFTITTLTGDNITDNRTVTATQRGYNRWSGYKGW